MKPDAAGAIDQGADIWVYLTRAVAVGCVIAMIALGLAWELWLAPTGARTLSLKVLPLVLPLAGLLKMRLYTYRWLSLLVWLYFAEGMVRATSEPDRVHALAWTEAALSLLLFAACATHVWWRLHRTREAA